MDDLLISLTTGRLALLIFGLLLLFALGTGIVMALLTRRRMMGMMSGGGWPCMAMLRGEGNTCD